MRQTRKSLIRLTLFILLHSSARSVSGIPYSVVVRTERDAYVAGEFVEISGYVMDQGNGSISTYVEVVVFTPENSSLSLGMTHSNSNGYFFTILALPSNASLGTYLVTATAEGPPAYVAFTVASNAITCHVNSSFTYPVMPILVYGYVYPAQSVELLLQFSRNRRDWHTIAYVNSNSSGYYSFYWMTPFEAGDYSIMASCGGTNSTFASLRVFIKESTSIALSPSSSSINLGQSVLIQGILNSTSRNATIMIRYEDPGGTSTNHTVGADPDGAFSDILKPDKEGTWKISASWPGDALNQRAESMEVKVSVGPQPPTLLFISIVAIEDIVVLSLLARHMYVKRKTRRP